MPDHVEESEAFKRARDRWSSTGSPSVDSSAVCVPTSSQSADMSCHDGLPTASSPQVSPNVGVPTIETPQQDQENTMTVSAGALTALHTVLERIAKAVERIADGSGALNGVLDGPADNTVGPAAIQIAAAEPAAPVPVAEPAAPVNNADNFDYGVGALSDNDSEADVNPASRCGVCKMPTADEQWTLSCGHFPYCKGCVDILKFKKPAPHFPFPCPHCKKDVKWVLMLHF